MNRQLFVIFIISLAAFGAAIEFSRTLTGRIVGGRETTIEEHPFQISLVYYGSHRCGGAIITEYFALTAAHCVYSVPSAAARYLQIRAGSSYRTSGGSLHSISYYTWHGSFRDDTLDYDIALIRVVSPFEFGSAVQPIELPSESDYSLPDGTTVSVSGWGRLAEDGTSPSILQVVDVPLMNNTYCGSLYSSVNTISERMICAGFDVGGKDACQGDSGGPLSYGNTLVGLVSWGNGCALPFQPGVYTNVANLRNWVIERTGVIFY